MFDPNKKSYKTSRGLAVSLISIKGAFKYYISMLGGGGLTKIADVADDRWIQTMQGVSGSRIQMVHPLNISSKSTLLNNNVMH